MTKQSLIQEPKKLTKVYRAEIKAIDAEKFTVEAIVSANTVDRQGEIVTPKAIGQRIDEYKKHPVLLSSHRYDDLMKQIGKAEEITIGTKNVTVRFKYFVGQGNPEADWAFKLAQNGIAAYSIGFMAHAWEDKSGEAGIWREYSDVELVEISQVLVPANREALASRRSSECEVEKELVEMAVKSFDALIGKTEMDEMALKAIESVEAKEKVHKELVDSLLTDESFLQKLAEKLSTKAMPKGAKEDEGYFKGVLDPAGGSPEAESEKTPDIKSLFAESASRHFNKGK